VSTDVVLRVDGLRVSYGKTVAVDDLSLEVNEGEVVALLGPNGAGKTSTLKAIINLIRRRARTITFRDEDIAARRTEEIAGRGLVLVPEGRHIFPTLSVRENLVAGATSAKDRRSADSDIDALFERFPVLAERAKQHAGTLSGGEQQQLAIARALVSRPRMLLLDEPSLGLAPIMVGRVFALLRELRDDGVTMLVVEQNAVQALKLASRAHVLANGRVVAAGTADDLRNEDVLASAYFGERDGTRDG
jgi:branched-chain amino acid transport system ATP-binding protein